MASHEKASSFGAERDTDNRAGVTRIGTDTVAGADVPPFCGAVFTSSEEVSAIVGKHHVCHCIGVTSIFIQQGVRFYIPYSGDLIATGRGESRSQRSYPDCGDNLGVFKIPQELA
jgi:hypothetical protein